MKKIINKIFYSFAVAIILISSGVCAGQDVDKISGNIVDVVNSKIYPGTIIIEKDRIKDIVKEDKTYDTFIIPGLVDSHVHIESSLLVPSEFARLAVVHGTVATVSDPHEIANVLGRAGIQYMLDDTKKTPFKFYFGASSCVPATTFETSGAAIDPKGVDELLKDERIKYLSEVMNYPGVINGESAVMAKIDMAKKYKKPIDGHAPGLRGKELEKYVKAGISTDHETYSLEEGIEKISLGMKVQIREGSAAKDFETLHPLIGRYPSQCMFCSDDKHPDDLVKGHINEMVKRALLKGYDRMDVLRCASLNPVRHYSLDVGLVQKGDWADFVVIDNFEDFNILKTYINGKVVSENGKSLIERNKSDIKNNFNAHKKSRADFVVKKAGDFINIIEAIDGQLITKRLKVTPKVSKDNVISDPDNDILKITVVNRYQDTLPAIAFVKNFGLKKGAIASSFAHDSHNVVAVGVSDEDLEKAANLVIENRGGLAIFYDGTGDILRLPIGGLMSDEDGYLVAQKYSQMTNLARNLGSNLRAPYMTVSFMALLVMPEIKLSDKGLFDGQKFTFMNLFESKE